MKYHEFIKHVQTLGQLNSTDEAQRATQATLETIRERVVGNEASQLAAQLPQELVQHLQGREGENGQHFAVTEFYRRVTEKEGVEPTTAVVHARAVFAALQSAVTPGEFADVKASFSEDYAELFAVQN